MNGLVRLSCGAYRALLPLYPPDLRERFGSEMIETFAEQTKDAWREGSLVGVLEVWSLTLSELFWIALPRQVVRPILVIPIVSLLSTSAIFVSLIWALQHSLVLNAWYHHVFGGGCH